MNTKKVIALLLSLLLYPGLGQLYLKRKKKGIIFMALTTVIIFILFIHFEFKLIHEFKAASEPDLIIAQASTYVYQVWMENTLFYSVGFILIGLVWIGSVGELLFCQDKATS